MRSFPPCAEARVRELGEVVGFEHIDAGGDGSVAVLPTTAPGH